MPDSSPNADSDGSPSSGVRAPRALAGSIAVAACALAVWFAWRSVTLGNHPVELGFFAAELAGAIGAAVVVLGLIRAGEERIVYAAETPDSHWFALVVADIVGRTRMDDLYRAIRSSSRAAPRWRPRNLADATISAVLLDGPRRLLIVVSVSTGLLLGVSPMSTPPWWAVCSAAVGYLGLSAMVVLAGRERLRFGDRMRWSFGAIGELVVRDDLAGHAPRRWLGAMAVAVGVSLAIALRGMSDRWTHGLAPMDYDQRAPALAIAVGLVLGALFTIQTTPRPQTADPHVVARRHDESSVRQSLLAAAVCIGLVGLVAGVAPASQDDRPDSVVATNTISDAPGVDDG